MRFSCLTGLAFLLLSAACAPQRTASFAVVDGSNVRMVASNSHDPGAILAQAGSVLGPGDALLFNGYPVPRDAPLPPLNSGTLQIRRAVEVSVDGVAHPTTARTVGEALSAFGKSMYAADALSPTAGTFISSAVAVNYRLSQSLLVRIASQTDGIRSASSTVGAALAGAGMPLIGLDYSRPAETEPLPSDGKVQVVRVSELITLAEKAIPFKEQIRDSSDVELGQEQIIQAGVNGLAVSRIRVRYEDGQETSRQTEGQAIVRPAQDRIAARGTKIVIKTATVNGVTIQYWHETQMYATVYSPCTSGGSGGCSSGTASGLRAGKGVVAVDPGLYAYLNGQRLYIPGYGRAVIGDVGGGYIVEQNTGVSRYRWIDLGFDDNNIVDMTGWVTVYFLAPAPATIPDILK